MALYDAFISYSHAKDRPIATALQSVIQKLGKPWYRRRALRVFRDDTSLSATPQLWPSIEQALRQSRFFVLIASPEAAASKWVGREVAFWLEHNSIDTLLLGLTDGELTWDESAGDFMQRDSMPLPEGLRGRFVSEPKWIDLRAYREGADPRNARFIELGADFAAAIRGMPKEDLLSQEVRQQRRALTLAWSAACSLLVLAGLAGWQWREALTQRDRAERTLAQATETTNGLVYDLAESFRNAGLPVSLVREILDRARALQDQLVDGGYATPALRRSQGVALLATVKTLLALGDTAGAFAAADRARRIFEALIAAGDSEAGHLQRNLAVSYGQIGDALLAQGKRDEALENFRAAAAALERLVASDRTNRVWQQHLTVALGRIGSVLMAQGKLDEALKYFRDSLAMRERLAWNPDDLPQQHNLAVAHAGIGDVLGQIAIARRRAGDREGFKEKLEEALASYRKSLAILERVAAAEPANTAWQRDLAVAYNKVGEVLGTQGRFVELIGAHKFAEARETYRKGLAVLERLAASDRSNVGWQRDLALAHEHVGDLLAVFGMLEDALMDFSASLAIFARLVEAHRGEPELQRRLRGIAGKIGDLGHALLFAGAFAKALEACDRAIAFLPGKLVFHAGRAHALMFLERADEARAIYLQHAGKPNVRAGKSWEAVVLEDFARLRQAGHTRPLMDEIETKFSPRG